jgi:hypothetical protein
MSDHVNVFDLRNVYVFVADEDADLPAAVRSQYNADAGRYELPTDELLDDLRAAVDDVRLVDDRAEFTVAFDGDPPEELASAAVFVDDERLSTRLLLPDQDAVEEAVAAGGTVVAGE